MTTLETFETKISTPIVNIDTHASRPCWTQETARNILITSLVAIYEPTTDVCRSTLFLSSSIGAAAHQKKDRKYLQYISQFYNDWTLKKPHFDTFTKGFVWDNFKVVLHQLLQFKPELVSFNLTEDCSIFFKATVRESNIYLELFFDEEIEGHVEAIVNVYRDGNVTLAYGGSIEDTFGEIRELFSSKDRVPVSTSLSDALSEAYFAPTEF